MSKPARRVPRPMRCPSCGAQYRHPPLDRECGDCALKGARVKLVAMTRTVREPVPVQVQTGPHEGLQEVGEPVYFGPALLSARTDGRRA